MSNKPTPRRKRRPPIPRDSPLFKIAEFTGERPREVEAAIAALVADGFTFEEVWDLLGAIPQGGKVVDMAAEHLGTRK